MLVPEEIRKITPEIGSQENNKNALAVCRLFTPWTHWSWFIVEANYETGECFGVVDGHEKELGYFDLKELEELNIDGRKIKFDETFEPMEYRKIMGWK